MLTRASPSGKRLVPAGPIGLVAWSALAPVSFELLPRGHAAGIYTFAIDVVMRTLAGAGVFQIDGFWSEPLVATTATVRFGANVPLTALHPFIEPRHIVTDGRLPFTLTLTPSGVTGSPVAWLNFPIDFILADLPEAFP